MVTWKIVLVVAVWASLLLLLCLQDSALTGGTWRMLPAKLQDIYRQIIPSDLGGQEPARGGPTTDQPSGWEPSLDFEVTRRLVETNLRGSWYYLSDLLREIYLNKDKMKEDEFNYRMKEGAERISVLQHDLWQLSQLDGADSWREREAKELSDMIQDRLHRLQNPPDCATAKKFFCPMFYCGLGCELHHIIYCLMAAYGTNRTIVIDFSKWRYTNNGWKDIFLPFSASCNITKDNITTWPGGNDSQTIQFQGSVTNPKPEHVPLAIPRDISDRLIRLVGEPGVWWVGQFVKYVFKYPPYIQEIISRVEKSINFQHPIVGVHVRRTDKKSEASYHDLEEYMEQVEQYYNGLQIFNPNVTRRIYLASDEPSVFIEAKKKYPHYEILYHKRNIDVVKDETRFTVTSLRDLAVDIYFLARSDYIVVTLSSNLGRLVYELMQTMRLDAPNRCYSLDLPYWYHGQRDSYVRARFLHQSHRDNGVRIEPGEKLSVSPPEASVFRKTLYEYIVSNNHARATMPLHKLQHLVDVVNVSYTYSD